MKHMLVVALLGCSGSSHPATPNVPTGPLELTFQGLNAAGGLVPEGSTLHDGDRIALSLRVTRPAYLYVMQFFPDGTAGVLFPQRAGEETPIEAGVQRIPATGWFELDKVTGNEHVYIVASTEPLARADASVKETVDTVRLSGKAPELDPAGELTTHSMPDPGPDPVADQRPDPEPEPKPEPKPAPKPDGKIRVTASGGHGVQQRPARASLATRGLHRVEADSSIKVTADEHGIAVFRFSFVHAAK